MNAAFARRKEKASRAARVWSAWSVVSGANAPSPRLEILQEKRNSATYRLHGAAPDGGNVIAKWLRQGPSAVELSVYERLLPQLPLPVLQCFGSVVDEVDGFRWMFVEEADGAPYNSDDPAHRATAARWLSTVHSSAASFARKLMEQGALPRVGPTEALLQARSAGNRIAALIDNPALTREDRDVLAFVVAQCGKATEWIEPCERHCRSFPHTLSHCDFVGKNFRVRHGSEGQDLLVFDWEMAGYGPPAADLAECDDLPSYMNALTGPMAEIPRGEIEMLNLIGRLMRWSASVDWASWGLEGEFVHKSMRKFRCYREDMSELSPRLRQAGLLI